MPATRTYQDFIVFMTDYTAFLGRMRADENEKLTALSSRELQKIEHSIAVSQANAKQLENYETRRLALQAEAGFEGLSFRDLITQAPFEEQESLWRLFSNFENNVAEIRFYNDKSMAVARDSMVEMDPGSIAPPKPGVKANNPYARRRDGQEDPNILETKA